MIRVLMDVFNLDGSMDTYMYISIMRIKSG